MGVTKSDVAEAIRYLTNSLERSLLEPEDFSDVESTKVIASMIGALATLDPEDVTEPTGKPIKVPATNINHLGKFDALPKRAEAGDSVIVHDRMYIHDGSYWRVLHTGSAEGEFILGEPVTLQPEPDPHDPQFLKELKHL